MLPCFSAYLSQDVAGDSHYPIRWDAEFFDIGDYFDIATGLWTPPAGLILLQASVTVSTDAAVDKSLQIFFSASDMTLPSINATPVMHYADGVNAVTAQASYLGMANGTDHFGAVVAFSALEGGSNAFTFVCTPLSGTYFRGVVLSETSPTLSQDEQKSRDLHQQKLGLKA